ncbi:MAG TPA: exonuclease domain-containing protein [Pyrinomonadaceae bacterium]|nr:exonuclease domain-containing protein [Pyrinomonadaceae bacterium]
MPRPRNLISDSPLVQETFDLVRESGGRATFAQIADAIFRLRNAPEDLAAALTSDLIQNDPRFSIEANHLTIKVEEIENRPLNEIDFVVVDVEAVSGRSIPTRVIEIGACRVRGGQIAGEFEVLLNPDLPMPRFISALTGITDEMLSAAPRFADVAEEWLDFAGDSVLVAHNSDFDLTLLNQEVARVFPGCRMRNADVCTVKLARRIAPYLDNHHLDALAEHFGFEIKQRHRAAGDARATAHILLRLLDELEIHGVRTLQESRKFRLSRQAEREMQLALDA